MNYSWNKGRFFANTKSINLQQVSRMGCLMGLKIRILFFTFFIFSLNLSAQTAGQELAKFWVENRFQACSSSDDLANEVLGKNLLTLSSALRGPCKNTDASAPISTLSSKECFKNLDKNLKIYLERDNSFSNKYNCKTNSAYEKLVKTEETTVNAESANVSCNHMSSADFKIEVLGNKKFCKNDFNCSNVKNFKFGQSVLEGGRYTLRCQVTKDPNYPCLGINLNSCVEDSYIKLLPLLNKPSPLSTDTKVQPSDKGAQ